MNNKKVLVKWIIGVVISISIIGGIMVGVDVYYNTSIEKAKETAAKLEKEKADQVKAKIEELKAKIDETKAKVEESKAKSAQQAKAIEEANLKAQQATEKSKSISTPEPSQKSDSSSGGTSSNNPIGINISEIPKEELDSIRAKGEQLQKEMEEDLKKRQDELNEQIAMEELRQKIALQRQLAKGMP